VEAGDPNLTPGPPAGAQPVVRPETVEEQVDGLRAWVAQLDRRLGIRTIALTIAVVLALAAGIVGVVLAQDAKDNGATKGEVASLRDQVNASTKEASQSTQDTIDELNNRIDALETRVATIASTQRTSGSELDVAKDDIDELRGQITDLQNEVNSIDTSPPSSGGGSSN
jgi:polyhydroxyalkanoate synthesis regulator phasin